MRDPVWVYDNWSAYAEGLQRPDDVPLTEELALRQLEHLARLQRIGVHFDYYMMNAFWFAPDGAYRTWRTPHWPEGPDRWIRGCLELGLKPGLWFGGNSLWQIEAAPKWQDSLAAKNHPEWPFGSLSMFEGGFLTDLMEAMQAWYKKGIRMFEIDMVNFDAATRASAERLSAAEIRRANEDALREALKLFRRDHPDVMLVAFNDFGGDLDSTSAPFPFRKHVDLRWLEVFDTLYSGDTRASDVPQANFWRSVDLYNDHMVRRYEQSGVPLERIDPFCTFSTTWFGYGRGKNAWKGMLLLTLARGSWKKTIYGDLGVLNDADARWFAKAQRMYAPLIALGRTKSFGAIPGDARPYGFASFDLGGALYTVVNPTHAAQVIELPKLSTTQPDLLRGRLLFRDAGYKPSLAGRRLVLGPGQMAVVGFGRYADEEHDLGVQDDVVIPTAIERLEVRLESAAANTLSATVSAPRQGHLRMFFQQRSKDGSVLKSLKKRRSIEVRQAGIEVPFESEFSGKEFGFGGVSWSACEIRGNELRRGQPVTVTYSIESEVPAVLHAEAYVVEY